MPPRKKAAPQQGGSWAARIVLLVALAAAAMGARFLLANGLQVIGIGSGLGHAARVQETPAKPTAAEAKTPQEFVERSIDENRVIVFSKSYCGFSARGKSVMRKHLGNDGFKVVELDEREDGGDIQDVLQGITGGRTVPRIFVDGKFIGGADDVSALDASGELEALLKQKGLLASR